jgi:hypothetical protein
VSNKPHTTNRPRQSACVCLPCLPNEIVVAFISSGLNSEKQRSGFYQGAVNLAKASKSKNSNRPENHD